MHGRGVPTPLACHGVGTLSRRHGRVLVIVSPDAPRTRLPFASRHWSAVLSHSGHIISSLRIDAFHPSTACEWHALGPLHSFCCCWRCHASRILVRSSPLRQPPLFRLHSTNHVALCVPSNSLLGLDASRVFRFTLARSIVPMATTHHSTHVDEPRRSTSTPLNPPAHDALPDMSSSRDERPSTPVNATDWRSDASRSLASTPSSGLSGSPQRTKRTFSGELKRVDIAPAANHDPRQASSTHIKPPGPDSPAGKISQVGHKPPANSPTMSIQANKCSGKAVGSTQNTVGIRHGQGSKRVGVALHRRGGIVGIPAFLTRLHIQ